MEELYNYNLNDNDIKEMLEMNMDITNLDSDEIKNMANLLISIGCDDNQIRNILISNPFYLTRNVSDILDLIDRLNELNINPLSLIFDSNPWLFNKDVFEINNYINDNLKKGKVLNDIIDEFESNPYIIDEVC